MKRRDFLRTTGLASVGVMVAACSHLDPNKPDPNCQLYAELDVTDGYIYDKVVNPCALPRGLVLALQGVVIFTSVDAGQIKEWIDEGRENFQKDITGEDFREWLGGLVTKINVLLGAVVAFVGRSIEVIPEDRLIKGGDKKLILHMLSEGSKAMDEFITQVAAKRAPSLLNLNMKF